MISPERDGRGEFSFDVEPDAVVARVGTADVFANELRWELAREVAHLPGRSVTPEARKRSLDRLIDQEIQAQKARELGLHERPEVRRAIRTVLADAFARQSRAPAAEIEDDDIRRYYEANQDSYRRPARARSSAVVLRVPARASAEERAEIRSRAQGIRKQLVDAGDASGFAAIAAEVSEDIGTRRRGGDLGWLPEGGETYRWKRPVVDAVFALESVGEISPLVETDREIVVLRLAEKMPASPIPLAEVEDEIRSKLVREARSRLATQRASELREAAEFTIYEDVLNEVAGRPEGSSANARPPSFPVGAGS